MSIFFYEPFYDFDRFFDTFDTTASPVHQNQGAGDKTVGAIRAFKPRMDLHEDSEKNMVTATFELPGIKKDEVQLHVHNGKLTVSAESKTSSEREENGYAIRERKYGKFSRTLQLPHGIKDTDIKAGMEDGILTVTFPKTTPEQAPKRITIG